MDTWAYPPFSLSLYRVIDPTKSSSSAHALEGYHFFRFSSSSIPYVCVCVCAVPVRMSVCFLLFHSFAVYLFWIVWSYVASCPLPPRLDAACASHIVSQTRLSLHICVSVRDRFFVVRFFRCILILTFVLPFLPLFFHLLACDPDVPRCGRAMGLLLLLLSLSPPPSPPPLSPVVFF